MIDAAKIDRINALAKKSKSVGLTDEERAEQAALRREYVEAFRANTIAALKRIDVREADGSVAPLLREKGKKE